VGVPTASRRWVVVQGSITAAVLITGLVVGATSVKPTEQVRAVARTTVAARSGPTAQPSPSAPAGASAGPTPPLIKVPETAPHGALRLLSHPAHEAWSRLLVHAPQGAKTQPPTALSLHKVSAEFIKPTAVLHDLRFNGYYRGVARTELVGHQGETEELWQFRQPVGAGVWYRAYTHANQPGPGSEFDHSFDVGRDGRAAYTTSHLDSLGYHFGVGTALEGDIIVHVRLFGTEPVTRAEIMHDLRRAVPPVARGIPLAGEFAHAVLGGATTPSVTT
jgi:hypothetical protein